VVWPHFQQFLHEGILGFMLVPRIVAMCLSMLKHLLIRFLALAPFWESHMSIQMTAMSDLGNALIIRGLDASIISSNRWILLMTSSIWLWAIGVPLLVRYGISRIFRYNLD